MGGAASSRGVNGGRAPHHPREPLPEGRQRSSRQPALTSVRMHVPPCHQCWCKGARASAWGALDAFEAKARRTPERLAFQYLIQGSAHTHASTIHACTHKHALRKQTPGTHTHSPTQSHAWAQALRTAPQTSTAHLSASLFSSFIRGRELKKPWISFSTRSNTGSSLRCFSLRSFWATCAVPRACTQGGTHSGHYQAQWSFQSTAVTSKHSRHFEAQRHFPATQLPEPILLHSKARTS